MNTKRKHQARVEDAETFKRLINSMDKFIGENRGNVLNVDDFVFDAENKLRKTQELIEQRLMDASIKLQNRDMELSLCKQKASFDSEGRPIKPNCGFEKAARLRAKKQVEIAQRNMSKMMEIMRYADSIANKYAEEKKSFMQLLDNKLPQAKIELQKQHSLMQEYLELKTK